MNTKKMTDRTINLLISSNVHYVHLGGDNYLGKSWPWWPVERKKNKTLLALATNQVNVRITTNKTSHNVQLSTTAHSATTRSIIYNFSDCAI